MTSLPAVEVAGPVPVAQPVSAVGSQDIDSTLRENRVFPPSPEFSAKAHIKSLDQYESLYKQSIDDPETFWAGVAQELHWFKPWDKVLDWNLPSAQWFVGGKLNLCYNCVDRHALGDRRGKTALIWEGEPGEVRRLTYAELHIEVQRFANALKSLGIRKGDRVAVYMGMTPELAIALLACARIGAFTRSSSADLPPTPSPTASTTQAASPSSPRTPATAAATKSSSSAPLTRP
jgi:acetyl-CoA synthetase